MGNCHRCHKRYGKKFFRLTDEELNEERIKHWEICKVTKRSPDENPFAQWRDDEPMFETADLETEIRIQIEAQWLAHWSYSLDRNYIDKYTTAYRSEIVRAILSH